MDNYYDWAYSAYYSSTHAQAGSSSARSRPTDPRASDANEVRMPPGEDKASVWAGGDRPESRSAVGE